MPLSKPLSRSDDSGFAFAQEMLGGDPTYAINFDRLQKHPVHGYIIFEYLLCEAEQTVTPHSSHPNRYWHKNARKFISLFRVAEDLPAKLVLVNYAKINTPHADEVKVIEVIDIDEQSGITAEKQTRMTRDSFQRWFRQLNRACG